MNFEVVDVNGRWSFFLALRTAIFFCSQLKFSAAVIILLPNMALKFFLASNTFLCSHQGGKSHFSLFFFLGRGKHNNTTPIVIRLRAASKSWSKFINLLPVSYLYYTNTAKQWLIFDLTGCVLLFGSVIYPSYLWELSYHKS